MVNTKILLSVVIVLLIGVAAASYQMTTNTPGLWQPTTSQDQKSSDQVTSTQSEGSQSGTQSETTSTGSQTANGGSSVEISITKAKSIAQNYIEQPGATAGTPKLKTMNGTKVYIVPVIYKGEQAGEIWIDAKTGKNVGGAGGAP
jgi:uncharacterized membrane protein YkoI